MNIFIPSRGRADKIDKYTLNQLHAASTEATKLYLVVPEKEFDEYLPVARRFNASLLYENEPDLPHLYDTLVQYAALYNMKRIAIVDDDLVFFGKAYNLSGSAHRMTSDELRRAFVRSEARTSAECPLVGWRHKHYCNRAMRSEWVENRRIIGLMFLYVPVVKNISFVWEHPELFDQRYTLELIQRGFKNAVNTGYIFDSYIPQFDRSGCGAYRTPVTYSEACVTLEKMYPEAVKLRTKTVHGKPCFDVIVKPYNLERKNDADRLEQLLAGE